MLPGLVPTRTGAVSWADVRLALISSGGRCEEASFDRSGKRGIRGSWKLGGGDGLGELLTGRALHQRGSGNAPTTFRGGLRLHRPALAASQAALTASISRRKYNLPGSCSWRRRQRRLTLRRFPQLLVRRAMNKAKPCLEGLILRRLSAMGPHGRLQQFDGHPRS